MSCIMLPLFFCHCHSTFAIAHQHRRGSCHDMAKWSCGWSLFSWPCWPLAFHCWYGPSWIPSSGRELQNHGDEGNWHSPKRTFKEHLLSKNLSGIPPCIDHCRFLFPPICQDFFGADARRFSRRRQRSCQCHDRCPARGLGTGRAHERSEKTDERTQRSKQTRNWTSDKIIWAYSGSLTAMVKYVPSLYIFSKTVWIDLYKTMENIESFQWNQ